MSAPIYQFTDPNILGVQDDGSPEGVVKAKIIAGDLVKVSMKGLIISTTGTVTGSYVDPQNTDGSGFSQTISSAGGSIKTVLFGKTIGIRFRRTSVAMPDISVVIDGMPYTISKAWLENRYQNALATGTEYNTSVIIATDLDDSIPHSVQVLNYSLNAIGFIFYGFLCEAKAGYTVSQLPANLPVQTTMTASYVAFGQGANYFAFRKIIYYNADSATRTVTLRVNSIIVWSTTVASLATIESPDFGAMQLGTTSSTIKWEHKVDAVTTTGVLATIITVQ